MRKQDMALRIHEINQELKGLSDERDELRAKLTKRMEPGEVFEFETEEET